LAAGFAFAALALALVALALEGAGASDALAWEAAACDAVEPASACAGAADFGWLAAGAGLLDLETGPPDELGLSATVHTAKNATVATSRPIKGRGRFAIKPLFGRRREDLSGLMLRPTGRPLSQFEARKNFFLKHRRAEPITRP
jgi:hypothetical protein